jgi:hypothetical protein
MERVFRDRPEKHCEFSRREPILSLAEKSAQRYSIGGQQCVDTSVPFSQWV